MNTTHRYFRVGDWVEVRSLPEILATLDGNGSHEGLPFMPEMVRHCGRRYRVFQRAEKIFLERHNYVARLRGTVFLEGVRCDGRLHHDCQMECLAFWKEAWLKPMRADGEGDRPSVPSDEDSTELPVMMGDKYYCQATELIHCTTQLPWWDVRQYFRDYRARKIAFKEWIGMLALLGYNKLRRVCGLKEHGLVTGPLEKTEKVHLGLQPGDLVQVKSREEIEATLDASGKNRGLGFSPEMVDFCGKTYRVLRRVERVIVEWTGEMRPITDTVILDGATCKGMARRCCPRDCHQLWREAWLKRVE